MTCSSAASLFTVFILKSPQIYRNLAFEAALLHKGKFGVPQKYLLLYVSRAPAVVLGSHQNAWAEVNMPALRAHGFVLARRDSGGGTVAHDAGNLNLSFIEHSVSAHSFEASRRANLSLLACYLRHYWARSDVRLNSRNDLVVLDKQFKISGSASRSIRKNASMHHCTLLLHSDLEKFSELLTPCFAKLRTRATQSVKSRIANLRLSTGDDDCVISTSEFVKHLAAHMAATERARIELVKEGGEVQFVDERQFETHLQRLTSRQWLFEKNPPCVIGYSDDDWKSGCFASGSGLNETENEFELVIKNGRFVGVEMPNLTSRDCTKSAQLVDTIQQILIGQECDAIGSTVVGNSEKWTAQFKAFLNKF